MSTRSRIGYERPDGSVRSVYCHSDGYPRGVGALLLKYYNNTAKVNALLDMGNISQLGPKIGVKHDFGNWNERWGTTTFYERDRGDKNQKAKLHESRESYAAGRNSWEIEFFYLFSPDDGWEYCEHGGDWQSLSRASGVYDSQESEEFEDDEIHGEGNPYESTNKWGNMITEKDILKYATKEEQEMLREEEESTGLPEAPDEDEIKKKAEEEMANRLLLNIHLSLIEAAKFLGDMSMPKEYRDKNIIDLFGNVKSRIAAITLKTEEAENEQY